MKFILYTSVLNHEHHDALAVPEIIRTARAENFIYQITGVLLFDGLNFTQYFEGNEADVDGLFKNIVRDQRHKNLVVLLTGTLNARLYPEWRMGYVDTSNDKYDSSRMNSSSDFNIEDFKQMVSHFDVE